MERFNKMIGDPGNLLRVDAKDVISHGSLNRMERITHPEKAGKIDSEHGVLNGNGGKKNVKTDPTGKYLCQCWCGAHLRETTPEAVKRGEAPSCKNTKCHKPR